MVGFTVLETMTDTEETRIIGEENPKYIIYTDVGIDFYLETFDQYNSMGVMKNGNVIKFHPEHVVAIRIT